MTAFKKLAKEDVSEDEIKDARRSTKITDKYIKDVECNRGKIKEIMTV